MSALTYTRKPIEKLTHVRHPNKRINMPSKRRISSADIARMAGLSRATVSYIINNRKDQSISEETRQRVLEAIAQSGYRPNSAARALASGKTKTIALWVPLTNRSVSGHFINHIGTQARADGYHSVVVEISGESPDSLSKAGLLDAGSVDGILAVDASGLINDLLTRFQNLPPIVSMGPAYSTNTDYVGVDLAGGSNLAIEHLISGGCRRITLLADYRHQYPGDPRFDAYAAGVASLAGEQDVLPLAHASFADAYRAVWDRFDRPNMPDALFCFNDECAIAANKALADKRIKVPDDVAIIGSDGIDETQYSIPDISTVAQPFEQISSLAWQYLRRRIVEPSGPIVGEVLPMHLLVRNSTRPIVGTVSKSDRKVNL
jgi:DNA-binding LacI/PurR family transcriptional regulator